jgi:hypothetical protein
MAEILHARDEHFAQLQRARGIAIALVSFVGLGSSLSAQPVMTVRQPLPKELSFSLEVTRVETSTPLEFTPVAVRFRLTVSVFGVLGNTPSPKAVRVCAKVVRPETTCYTIPAAQAGGIYAGRVTVVAPFAGAQSPIRLVAIAAPTTGEDFGSNVIAEGELRIPVAARYDIGITGFQVEASRSNQTDTQWITLLGMVSASPAHPSASPEACHLAGFAWCIPPRLLGDNGGGYHVVHNARVGSYDLVPERETDLRFLFYLDNIGTSPSAEIAAGVANGFSKVGLVILSAYSASQGSSGGSSFASQLDDVMEKMHSSATASCDGRLADDILVLTNHTLVNRPDLTLDGLTRSSGSYTAVLPSPTEEYHNKDGDFICDRRGGKYRVWYTVFRTSWQPWAISVYW